MTRTIRAREIKKGMKVQLRMEVEFTREYEGRIIIHQEDGRSIGLAGDLEVEVLQEPRPEEPAPGSVVRTPSNDTFCRTENGNGCWQRVNGVGVPWTWDEILSLANGNPEILFNPEGR